MAGFRLAVDIGGTFTDVVIEGQDQSESGKVLTTHHAPEEGVIRAVQLVLEKAKVRPGEIELAIHGTTLATNAIIERRGGRTALITTQGFRDTLEFAFGHRFDQYDLEVERPEPLVSRPFRLEVTERMAADGSILLPLDEETVHDAITTLRAGNIESVAVCFLHAYRNNIHERRVSEILRAELPGVYISQSHEVCPEIREYERTSTTAANAYVQPLMANYLGRLAQRLKGIGVAAPLLMIMSSGSLTSIETAMRLPIRLVESGPAGGAILAQHIARQIGAENSVALDMGGTTAKIILLTGYEPRHSRSMEVARAYRFLPGSGLPLRIPVIDMIEIGAGGGSIAHIDELRRIAVGPESAGSSPGPACYGLGGTRPTVTDADLVLGKLDAHAFAAGTMVLDNDAAWGAIETHIATFGVADRIAAAAGIAEIVDENMTNAMRVHAADAGEELESRVLIATGGAGPLHAARIAQKLGIDKVVIPFGAGVGSAYGFLKAPIAYEAVRSHMLALGEFDPLIADEIFASMRREAEEIVRLAAPDAKIAERRFADMRYRGQGHELSVEIPVRTFGADDGKHFTSLFEQQYRKTYGRIIPGLRAEALTWTLVLTAIQAERSAPSAPASHAHTEAPAAGHRQVFDAQLGKYIDAAIVLRNSAAPGSTFSGPALVVEDQTTIWTPSGFNGHISPQGHVILTRKA